MEELYNRIKDRRIVVLYRELAYKMVSGGGMGAKIHRAPSKLTVLRGTVQMIDGGKLPDETFEELGQRDPKKLEMALGTLEDIRELGFTF